MPYFPRVYETGTLTVTLENTSSGPFPNRCADCPAWCDPSHHLHAKMTAKFPGKCGELVGPPNPCAGKDAGWWCAPDRRSLLHCDGKGNLGSGDQKAQECTNCTTRDGYNDVCLTETTHASPGLLVFTGKFKPPVQPTAYDYAVALVDLKNAEIKVNALTAQGFTPSEVPFSDAAHPSVAGEEASPPAGVPYSTNLHCLASNSPSDCAKAVKPAKGASFKINSAPWGERIVNPVPFSVEYWPTRTLRADGRWLRWADNDDVLFIGAGSAKIVPGGDEAAPDSWPQAVGNRESLLVEGGKIASGWGKGLDTENSWSMGGVSSNGRYLILIATAGQNYKFWDHGLTRRDLAFLALTPREMDGAAVLLHTALMFDSGHATQAWLNKTHLVHGTAPVLAGLEIVSGGE